MEIAIEKAIENNEKQKVIEIIPQIVQYIDSRDVCNYMGNMMKMEINKIEIMILSYAQSEMYLNKTPYLKLTNRFIDSMSRNVKNNRMRIKKAIRDLKIKDVIREMEDKEYAISPYYMIACLDSMFIKEIADKYDETKKYEIKKETGPNKRGRKKSETKNNWL